MRESNISKKNLYYYHCYYCNSYYSIITIAVATDTNDEISKNSSGCAKNIFKSGISVSIFQCHSGYYLLKDALKLINQMKVIVAFVLICLRHLNKKLHELSSPCNPLVPPWPLDQISIICFEQCRYLRSFMLNICTEVLRTPYQHNRPKISPFLSIRRVTPVYLRTSSQLPWNL